MAASSSRAQPPATGDGRVRRGARNHEAIVDAMCALVRAGRLPPTVEDVARHAGVGTRTVFRQFADLDALYRGMGERVLGEIRALVTVTPPTGDLATDLRALVDRRAQVFEHVAPFRRAARLVRHGSAFLQQQDAIATRVFRAGLVAVVGPHLGGDPAERIEALDVLLSFEAWDRLREQQRLSARRAAQVLLNAALALTQR